MIISLTYSRTQASLARGIGEVEVLFGTVTISTYVLLYPRPDVWNIVGDVI